MKKINHHTTSNPVEELDLSHALVENRLFQFISEHSRKILYLLLALLAIFVIMYKLSSSKKAEAESDYYYVVADFSHLKSLIGSDNEAEFQQYLSGMKKILVKHPELHGKYDAPIAQTLIFAGNVNETQEFTSSVMQRVKEDETPSHISYAENTLIVNQKKYKEALDRAIALKKEVNPETSDDNEILYGMNLIRIATLLQEVGTKDDEIVAWQEFEDYAAKHEKGMKELINRFSDGNVTLFDYIEYRKRA